MGHSTSSGRATGGVNESAFTQNTIDSAIRGVSGRALTSADRDRFEEELDRNAVAGDAIEARENNRYHSITSSYTKLENGMWHYERTNNDTGERYENRDVVSTTVASNVLGTGTSINEPTRWTFRSRRQRDVDRATRAMEANDRIRGRNRSPEEISRRANRAADIAEANRRIRRGGR